MALITSKVITLAKIEGTSGSDAFSGTGDAAYAVLARDIDLKADPNVLERQFQSSSISPWQALLGTNLYSFSFQTEFKWNGNTAGSSAVPWETEPCWKAAGWSATYTPLGGEAGYCTLAPISSGWTTATLYFYFDGLLVKCIGSAMNVEMVMEAGGLAVLNWSGFATYTRPTDVAMIASPVYDSQTGIPVRGATWTINPGGGAKSITASKFQVTTNTQIARRMSAVATWGVAGFQITGRNIVGSFDPETTVEADATSIPWWQTFDENTQCAMVCNLGATNGNQVQMSIPKATLDSNAFADRDGLRVYEVPFHAGRTTADDEMTIVLT